MFYWTHSLIMSCSSKLYLLIRCTGFSKYDHKSILSSSFSCFCWSDRREKPSSNVKREGRYLSEQKKVNRRWRARLCSCDTDSLLVCQSTMIWSEPSQHPLDESLDMYHWEWFVIMVIQNLPCSITSSDHNPLVSPNLKFMVFLKQRPVNKQSVVFSQKHQEMQPFTLLWLDTFSSIFKDNSQTGVAYFLPWRKPVHDWWEDCQTEVCSCCKGHTRQNSPSKTKYNTKTAFIIIIISATQNLCVPHKLCRLGSIPAFVQWYQHLSFWKKKRKEKRKEDTGASS